MNNTTNQNITNCQQCPKHCPLTDLQCGRGRRFLETMQQENMDGQERIQKPEQDRPGDRREFRRGQGHTHGRGMGVDEAHGDMHFHGHEKGGFHGHGRPWEGMEGDDELSALLGRCGHHLYHRPSKGRGQGRILKILASQSEVTQKELQEALGVQPGSASEIISKLEDRGLVSRERDADDKRRVVLRITEAGRERAEASSCEEKGQDLYEALSTEEQNTLKSLLKKLLESWSTRE